MMEITEFLKRCQKYPSHPIINLYLNLQDFAKHVEFVEWSIGTSSDIIFSNPELLAGDLNFLNSFDEEEAEHALEEIKGVLYNQLFIAFFPYFETFIDDFINLIYDKFFEEISQNDVSETSYMLLDNIKTDKENMPSYVTKKLEFIKKFTRWDNKKYGDLRKSNENHRILRNSIAHGRGKVSDKYLKKISSKNFISNKSVQLTEESFGKAIDEMISYCLDINDDLVKNNPILASNYVR